MILVYFVGQIFSAFENMKRKKEREQNIINISWQVFVVCLFSSPEYTQFWVLGGACVSIVSSGCHIALCVVSALHYWVIQREACISAAWVFVIFLEDMLKLFLYYFHWEQNEAGKKWWKKCQTLREQVFLSRYKSEPSMAESFLIDDRLYSTILCSLEQTHCACMGFYMSDKLFIVFFYIHQSSILTVLAWLVPHETAAVLAQVLCTPYNHAPYHLTQSHIRKVYACLAVTCHLHFLAEWPNLLCATVVTPGWNGYWNKSQHRKSTLEKKICPLLLQGFDPMTFQSHVWCCNHWAIPAPESSVLKSSAVFPLRLFSHPWWQKQHR